MKDKLRKLILENPDLPIIVCCGEEANSGDWAYEYHFNYSCHIVECTWLDDRYFDDRDELICYIIEEIMPDKPDGWYEEKEMVEWAENYIKENNIEFKKYIEISVG